MIANKIPPEVLSDIFLECVTQTYQVRIWSFLQPLRISHVCHSWREVAISDGRLWSYFRADDSSFDGLRDIKAIFDVFLARTKGALLHFWFRFNFKNYQGGERVNHVVYMLNTLVSQQHRWEEAFLVWRGREYGPSPILDMRNMPMLTTMDLTCGGETKAFIDIGQSPKLKRVSIWGDVELTAVRSCLAFLEATPFLEEIHINFEGDASAPDTLRSEKRVLTSRLQYLRLESYYTGPELVLDNVTLPSLKALELMSSRAGQPLLDFFHGSSPPLTFLHLDCADMREDTVIEILRLLPTLREFRYFEASVSARFFQELTITDSATGGAQIVCPALETLVSPTIQFMEDRRTCIDAFISMLESRSQIVDSFKKVGLPAGGLKLDVTSLRDTSDLQERLEIGGFFVSRMCQAPRWTPFSRIGV
ncbi:hypothetical protein ACEPAI_8760 [Sanghuangporus weigelae]